jgi:hypothetical protein
LVPWATESAISDLDFEEESFGFQVDDEDEPFAVEEKHLAVLWSISPTFYEQLWSQFPCAQKFKPTLKLFKSCW